MGSTFNPQILVEKLAKLNSSQQSIETLSHWCIFHMNKAKQVVETWARQFRCSPRDQRLAFLYLANDILQNSRRKGSEFVGEFWKVLPDALHNVMDNTDESGRNAALRLVRIWEERKVFGSRGQILKEELAGRHLETSNKNEKHSGLKLQHSAGNALDKIVSGYQIIYGGQLDEDAMISKCKNTISCIEKVEKEIGGDLRSAQVNVEDFKGHHSTLRDFIEQLSAVESSRINLICHLREALQEQEMKLDQVRNELKAAHTQSEKADNLCRQLLNPGVTKLLPEQGTNTSKVLPNYGEQSAPVMYTRQIPVSEQSEENTKSAAAAVAAKLTASTSSAEMLSFVLSSLASEGVISSNSVKEKEYPPEKRAKIDQNDVKVPPVAEQQPPLPSCPPPLPPMPPMVPLYPVPPFMQTAGSVAYGYNTNQQAPRALPGYPSVGAPVINSGSSYTCPPPPKGYQNYQIEGGFCSQPTTPISRQ
ncbi:regulation of nuclear pre-mRNA domain-containing protein 1A-like isoform X2 [Cynara cardunculus var. scolymus]|uniref:CID domain-containing protein n=1 Tax=Cynara cardunculus var. scolymus TaxID=59895 RepID=A0A103Y4L1_CYNCS|nr:regulation of nuclear pre-mRNA domain-containing protein 1A-like isoform X2 [Cynara cardunculus var. scolymus]KVI02420.1 hypothetical protein Ccrd_019292 [Cynara cardunculus var. scolymus]